MIDEGEYIQNAYEKVLKVAQIETMEGYENLEEILQVEGIDSLFIGATEEEAKKAKALCVQWVVFGQDAATARRRKV